jgi:hypothetical protein
MAKNSIMYMAKFSIIIEKNNNYWKSIIIDFFQSPISIIIEKFNIHLNNYWNRYWKILNFFAFQSELKKNQSYWYFQ